MASLLGILWEIELGQPALASFLDQNWLEGAGSPGAASHFETILAALRSGGFIDDDGRPIRHRREEPDVSPSVRALEAEEKPAATGDFYSFTAPVRLDT